MQIILQEDVEKLGNRGEVVEVAEGYARNFLLPRKLGLEATAGNLKRLERMRAHFAKKEATEKDAAEKLGELLAAVALEFTRKAGENDQLFGSVTSLDVAEALAAKGFEIDRKQDPAGRADQGDGRIRSSGEAAPRSDCECEGRGEEGRVRRRSHPAVALASGYISGFAGEPGVPKFGTPFFCADAFPLFRSLAQAGTVDASELNAHNLARSLNGISYTRAPVVAECERA